MRDVFFAFLMGFVVNWLFTGVTRMLPARLVRFPVRIGDVNKETNPAGQSWNVPVYIGPPGPGRALMAPLVEDLEAQVRCDRGDWCTTGWDTGDISTRQFTASHTARVYVVLLTSGSEGMNAGVGDKYPEEKWRVTGNEGEHTLEVRVMRTIDGRVAANKTFRLRTVGNKVVLVG